MIYPKNRLFQIIRGGVGRVSPQVNAVTSSALVRCSNADARAALTMEQAERMSALPLGRLETPEGIVVTVAVSEVSNGVERALQFAIGERVRLIRVQEVPLRDAIFAAYRGDDEQLAQSVNGLAASSVAEPDGPPIASFRSGAGEVAKFLETLVDYAIAHEASDLHIVPEYDGTKIRLRVHGELLRRNEAIASPTVHAQLISRIKVLAGLDTTQRNAPQDGVFQVPITSQNRPVKVRVSLMPNLHGESAVLRFQSRQELPTIDRLGFGDPISGWIIDGLTRGEGMILYYGETGSGKSTSMYACLKSLIERGASASTIEDPVEIEVPGASQTSLSNKLGVTYDSCIRSMLRQDPDVILVGEIRDALSARAAIDAALTGHLLLSTLHARGPKEALQRLSNLGIDGDLQASALVCLVGQRLLPALCPACKVIDLASSNAAGFDLYRPVGCGECDYSGRAGRVLAAEGLLIDSSVRDWLSSPARTGQQFDALLGPHNHAPLQSAIERLMKEGRVAAGDYLYGSTTSSAA